MPYNGIHILIDNAVCQGFWEEKYPNSVAVMKIIDTDIPVSSHFGRESIQAIAKPVRFAEISRISEGFFIPF